MYLRNIVFRTKNIILQEVNTASDSKNPNCIIIGSGYSVSVDNRDRVVYKDPLFFPPSGKSYGDITVYSLFYTNECQGLDVAAKELATYIDYNMKGYANIILHGHSKCGACFAKVAEYVRRKLSFVIVSAPLNRCGTPIMDKSYIESKLNWLQKKLFYKFFSNHAVDRDIRPNSDFLKSLDLYALSLHSFIIFETKCPPYFGLTNVFMRYMDRTLGIDGDGIIPAKSQIPGFLPCLLILATHMDSLKSTIPFVQDFLI